MAEPRRIDDNEIATPTPDVAERRPPSRDLDTRSRLLRDEPATEPQPGPETRALDEPFAPRSNSTTVAPSVKEPTTHGTLAWFGTTRRLRQTRPSCYLPIRKSETIARAGAVSRRHSSTNHVRRWEMPTTWSSRCSRNFLMVLPMNAAGLPINGSVAITYQQRTYELPCSDIAHSSIVC
jgi:hypothetical protein